MAESETDSKKNQHQEENISIPYKTALLTVALSIVVWLTIYANPKYMHYICKKLQNETTTTQNYKKFRVYGQNPEGGYLQNVFTVLDRIGYKNDTSSSNWDLLWAHNYPFNTLYSELKNLRSHQKVNKFPGSGYITNKVELATTEMKYIPPAFRLPKDKLKLLKYVEANPKKKFVEKNNYHRNIRIRNITNINLDGNDTFVQEFVDNPLIISGYKFDIGVYVIFTSVDPLRVYIYKGDFLLRFCPVKYYPFDPKNVDKYVVGDDYLPTWDVPGLKHYYKTLGYGMAVSLNAYLRSKGKDPSVIWKQIEDSIRIVALAKEKNLVESLKRFASKNNFFEMMRFDFVVTEELKVFLMEANMSPNLSSAHFPQNRLLFEQIIFNLFGLIGLNHGSTKSALLASEEEMRVADKNIMVFPNECHSANCRQSCTSPICELCRPCLSERNRNNFLRTYLEHVNKGDCKRIYPPPMKSEEIDIYDEFEEDTPENQLQLRWFQGKCLMDASWCV
ncbi:hypothetical protein RI129_002530 [Pyrocoelia pectoralis]|uniref:Tubulin polyglutamylase TTLL6 n=1 Tax=Pyrocoelia pectoralis TaxID=417401 RepID=A0AAN7VMZ7_9COLE